MIIKNFEINKKKFDNQNFFLVYGENEGLKNEVIDNLKKNLRVLLRIMTKTKLLMKTKYFMKRYLINHFLKKKK